MPLDRVAKQVAVRRAVEYRRRRQPVEVPHLFPEQRAAWECQERWQAVFTPRRSGKSFLFGTQLWVDALRYPGRQQIYVGLTQAHAERVIYREILARELPRRRIEHEYHKQDCLVTFANGSTIQLLGGDSSPKSLEQVLGGRPHRVIVDEAQAWTQDLEAFCTSKIWPALQDYLPHGGGWLELGGTPGLQLGDHYWFRVTKTDAYGAKDPSRLAGWVVHSWPMSANPHMRAQFEAESARREKEAAGRYDWTQQPDWRREWLGQWVLDAASLVYQFVDRPCSAGGNVLDDPELCESLLGTASAGWTYVIGIDLGFRDPTGIVLGAWRPADPRFYIVRSYKRTEMAYSEVGAMARAFADQHNVACVAVDVSSGAAKQMCESLRLDYGLPSVDADKRGKPSHVSRMNADFLAGKIAIIPEGDGNRELMREWQSHVLDAKATTWAEPKKHDNHLADAALYAWHASLHRFQQPAAPPPLPPTPKQTLLERKLREAAASGFGAPTGPGASRLGDWG